MNGTISAVYFSPTHTTQALLRRILGVLSEKTAKEQVEIDLTLPGARGGSYSFEPEDLLVFGFPVYGGRVPKLLASDLSKLQGKDTPAVIVAVYGNRDYDDALQEAKDILTAGGFRVIAAGAFLGEHSYSFQLAAGRPDEKDITCAGFFAGQVAEKLSKGSLDEVAVKGNTPYKNHMPDSPFLPKTKDTCTGCMICARGCPMGIISAEDPKSVKPVCITCHACVKSCPVQAKHFDAEPLAKATAMLESKFMARKEPEIFV